MKTIDFNINHYVRVKLSNEGLRILREQHEDLKAAFPKLDDFVEPVVDEEGYSKFQMWSLMRTFGEAMSACKLVPFETWIQFEVEDSEL